MRTSGSLCLYLIFVTFSFCLFCPIPICLFLFCSISFPFLRCLVFPEERQRGCGPDRRGVWEGTGRCCIGRGNYNQNTLYKKYLFPIKIYHNTSYLKSTHSFVLESPI